MENINFILPEIFISLGIMFLLMIGVFKNKSTTIVYTLSVVVLLITLGLIVNFPSNQETYLFNSSYKIDQLSTFMKIITIISGIFVLISSYKYVKIEKIFKIEYSILILCSILGMLVMISSYDLIVFYIGLELQSLSLYVLAAFNQALIEHKKEDGTKGRYKRYKKNCKIICDGMAKLGFKQLLPNEVQAPIIITFLQPKVQNFDFKKFYNSLSDKGFLIYHGKLTVADTFRIGCIGNLYEKDMNEAILAVENTLKDLDIKLI